MDHRKIRASVAADAEPLAALWHGAWHDAHAAIVPPGLVAVRDAASFLARLRAMLHEVRVLGPPGAPIGFYRLKDDELEHFYVAGGARGTGVAQVLLADAETALAATGLKRAWLGCAVGNSRAARFYEKAGWERGGQIEEVSRTGAGDFPVQYWRYEKAL